MSDIKTLQKKNWAASTSDFNIVIIITLSIDIFY